MSSDSHLVGKDPKHPLRVFAYFPTPYTQGLILQALTSCLPYASISVNPHAESDSSPIPHLQWADYDLLYLDKVLETPNTHLISSYIYRKTLIRKHMLQNAVQEYLAKQRYRNVESLLEKSIPKGWTIELQMADELDELLMDELYDLREVLDVNAALTEEEESSRKWFILKPGMSDKGQGIRLFSTEDELRRIFEEFEPESSDEEYESGEEEEHEEDEGKDAPTTSKLTPETDVALRQKILSDFPDDEPYEAPEAELESDEEEVGTGIQTSQLRHFVIQEYLDRPLLLNPSLGKVGGSVAEEGLGGHKFHLRAYVMMTGTYKLYLARTMLALFTNVPYAPPKRVEEDEVMDLSAQLTNTCLQPEEGGEIPEQLAQLYWSLEGEQASQYTAKANKAEKVGVVTKEWLEATFDQCGDVIAETVKAAAECGSFGLQLLPNAFEIFGVDLLLSYPEDQPSATNGTLGAPQVTLLEFNASADFTMSGEARRDDLLRMFKGAVDIAIKPFFGIEVEEPATEWKLIGEAETRGAW